MTDAGSRIRGLYAIIDTASVRPTELDRVSKDILEGGARLVQIRAHDSMTDAELLMAAHAMRRITREHGAVFIVNDRADIAFLSRADGIHLGLDDIDVSDARRLLGPGAIIGASTHNAAEARDAARKGADYVSLGPVFPTRTKKDAHTPRGLEMLSEVSSAVDVPVVAIGGITGADCGRVIEAGASAVAMISELLFAPDIKAKTASVVAAIESALT